MNERSYSLPKLPSQSPSRRQNNLRYIEPRLNFPKPGDSSIFSNVGRKHFENHSDKMLKIILPEKFAAQKPIILKRQASYPPPHLARQFSERRLQTRKNSEQYRDIKKMFARDVSIREKIEDELDRMKKSLDSQKRRQPSNQIKDAIQISPKLNLRERVKNLPKIDQFIPLTPAISAKKETFLQRNQSQLLYNPQNKEKYDAIAKGRWLNPTNLSTGLSII